MKHIFTTILATIVAKMVMTSAVFGQNFTSRATIDQNFCGSSVIVVMERGVDGMNLFSDVQTTAAATEATVETVISVETTTAAAFGSFEMVYVQNLTYIPRDPQETRGPRRMPRMLNEETFRQIVLLRLQDDCKQNVLDVIEVLRFTPGVYFAEPNYVFEIAARTPNDPFFSGLWGMQSIQAPEAWAITVGSHDVKVGVIDIGFQAHSDLNANFGTGWDFNRNRELTVATMTENTARGDHGNHVAGTIGAVGDNGVGVTGVSWNVTLVPFEVWNGNMAGDIGGWGHHQLAALNRAIADNIPVVNMSMSGGQALITAIQNNFRGLFVWAAGNDGNNPLRDPNVDNSVAGYLPNNMLGVGAHDQNNARASFSNFGVRTVEIWAPGVGINSTVLNNGYGVAQGTSMAAPHVAGVAALLMSLDPDLTGSELKNLILEGAVPITIVQPSRTPGTHQSLRLNAHGSVELLANIDNAPIFVGFEETANTDLPSGWTHSAGHTDAWRTTDNTIVGVQGNQEPHTGNRQLVRGPQDAGNSAWAFSQPVRLVAGVAHEIRFWYRAPGTQTQFDNFKAQVGATRSLTGSGNNTQMIGGTTILQVNNQRVQEWTEVVFEFRPTFTGVFYIGFHCMTASGQGSFIAIDDISIVAFPGNDLELIMDRFSFTQFPTFMQIPTFSARARNNGRDMQFNVVFSGTLNGNSIGQSSPPVFTLPVGATSANMTFVPNPRTASLGNNTLTYIVNSVVPNQGTSNTLTFTFTGTENVLAVDNATTFTEGFGSDAQPMTFGTVIELTDHVFVNGIQVGFSDASTQNYSISLFAMTDDLTLAPTPLFTQEATRNATGFSTVNVPRTPLRAGGRYFVAINQLSSANISVAFDGVDGRMIYVRDGNNLTPTSGFGAPAIRMVLENDPNQTNIVTVETGHAPSLQVFPNPVTDQLHIVIPSEARDLFENTPVEIFDMNGQRVFAAPITGYQTTIDISHLPNGMYIVRIGNNTVRIIKQ